LSTITWSHGPSLPAGAQAWLFKSEPETFSWQHLLDSPRATTAWEGVRNYQARNRLRDAVAVGDGVLFYHSSCARPAVVGVGRVTRAGYPDASQFDVDSPYFDPKSTPERPRWFVVDVRAHHTFAAAIDRKMIAADPKLAHLELCQRGSRLSIQAVDRQAWRRLITLSA
jgi:predicted RNA-binding protein with PUA-like domain